MPLCGPVVKAGADRTADSSAFAASISSMSLLSVITSGVVVFSVHFLVAAAIDCHVSSLGFAFFMSSTSFSTHKAKVVLVAVSIILIWLASMLACPYVCISFVAS